jgi:hypothetical protein
MHQIAGNESKAKSVPKYTTNNTKDMNAKNKRKRKTINKRQKKGIDLLKFFCACFVHG